MRRMRPRGCGERGAAIEEVLIAALILGTAGLIMLGAFTAAITTAGRSQRMSQATSWTIQQIEELRDQPFDSIADRSVTNPLLGFARGEIDRTDLSTDLMRIDVRVFRGAADLNPYFTLSTMLARK